MAFSRAVIKIGENTIANFRDALTKLISGDYSSTEVTVVVTFFASEAKRILIHKESLGWRFRNFITSRDSELESIAIDFIAPLFARDGEGVFYILRQHFEPDFGGDDEDFQASFQRLIFSHVQQEFIRLFQERDPVGKVLHRSLQYLLSSHPEWQKIRSNSNGSIITDQANSLAVMADSLGFPISLNTRSMKRSLTHIMELAVSHSINAHQLAVPVYLLFQHLNSLVNLDLDGMSSPESIDDTTLVSTISFHIAATIQHIDSSLLTNYESKAKLTPDERRAFRSALTIILEDFAQGEVDGRYADYLNQFLPDKTCRDAYPLKYKKQFEYVAKTAKKDFSARIKSDYNH